MKELLYGTIEEKIINMLKSGALLSTEIVKRIQDDRKDTPKQSVYKALRQLKQKEIITKVKKTISLHEVWIEEMRDFFSTVQSQNSAVEEPSALTLKDKEFISYSFSSLISLDMFWAHAFMLFMKHSPAQQPIFLYNPHEWFLLARNKSEQGLMRTAKQMKKPWIHLVAGKTKLDLEIKHFYDQKYARVHFLGKHIFGKDHYINIFGDFIIEVHLDSKSTEEIEKIYETYTTKEQALERFILIMESKKFRHKMKISKHQKNARKIRNIFSKYFFID
jgi:DNA-binding PadR family transcriptional regulator